MAKMRLLLDTPKGWQHLPVGRHLLGRGEDCAVVIDSGRVSRHHAAITVTEEGATLEDLGSANGTFVAGERVTEPHSISHGDFVVIGDLGLEVSFEPDHASARDAEPVSSGAPPGPYQPPTSRVSPAEVLAGAADRELCAGHPEQAERLLDNWLGRELENVRAGRPARDEDLDAALLLALRLAVALGASRWVDYTLRLATARCKAMTTDQAALLLSAIREAGATASVLSAYTQALRGANAE